MSWAMPFVLALSIAAPRGAADAPAKKVTADDLTDGEIEEFLAKAEIVRTRTIGSGVTGSLRATLRRGAVEHDAQIQFVDLQKPLGNLSGGDAMDFRDSYKNNVAAYRLDRLLGLGMIPVSVSRTFEQKSAAFTWWVDDVLMSEMQHRDQQVKTPDVEAWNRQMYVVRIFDQLIYNFDRNLGNLLIDKSWRIWMIDHTRAFKIFKELKTTENLGTRIPKRLLEALRRLDRPTLERSMKGFLTGGQLGGLLARRDHIVRYFDERIREIGEGEVFYDLPERIKAKPGSP